MLGRTLLTCLVLAPLSAFIVLAFAPSTKLREDLFTRTRYPTTFDTQARQQRRRHHLLLERRKSSSPNVSCVPDRRIYPRWHASLHRIRQHRRSFYTAIWRDETELPTLLGATRARSCRIKIWIPINENTEMDEEVCPSCRRRFGERCQRDQKVTQRCGECRNCNRLECCVCRSGSDSDEMGEDSPIQTPRYQGHRQRQTLTKGKHGWGTADLQLDEVLIDSFEMRQRMWTMDAMLFTPEKKKRPKGKGARRRRRGRR